MGQLVVSRRKGQKIRIGSDIQVEVCEVRGKQVRLGIEAPSSVPIVRNELGELNRVLSEPPIESIRPLLVWRLSQDEGWNLLSEEEKDHEIEQALRECDSAIENVCYWRARRAVEETQ